MEAATLRRVVLLVAILNLAYFGIEFSVALKIGSVSLFADSIDFLEDTSINLLIARALRWSATNRARVGLALAGIILVPSAAALWQTWQRFLALVPPAALPLSLVGGGALLVNLSCIVTGEIPRAQRQSHARRVLSARNDHVANVAIIGRTSHCLHPVGLARLDRRVGYCRNERRRRT